MADIVWRSLTVLPYHKALDVAKAQNLAAMFVVLADDIKTDGSESNVSDNVSDDNIDDWQVVQTPAMQALRADKKP